MRSTEKLPQSIVSAAAEHAADPDFLQRHGLVGIAAAVAAAGPASGPWVAQNLAMQQELERVTRAFGEQGVRYLLLKGTALGRWLYPDPAWRMMSDLDILVPPHSRETAENVLEKLGYRATLSAGGSEVFCEQQYVRRIGDLEVPVDLHWALSTQPALRRLFSFEELWDERLGLGEVGHGLGEAHALLHAAHHRAALEPGKRDRLIWLLDLHLLWCAMDEATRRQSADIALSKGTAGLLYDALATLRQRFDTPVDRDIRFELDRAAGRESITPLLFLHGGPRRLWFELRHLPGWRARLRYLWQVAFPRPAYVRHRFGPLPLGYARRAWRGVRRYLGGG